MAQVSLGVQSHAANRSENSQVIRLEGVTRTVTSGSEQLTILDQVTLFVPAGQFVAVTGASGSGKSTLLSIVAGLDAPTRGDVYVAQQRVTAMTEDALADLRSSMIGFVFQSFHLIPSLTAYENVVVPMELADQPGAAEQARRLIDEVGLSDRSHHYPSQLSGGEQQRVAIARAFANRPSILLADEPTGNLDTLNGTRIFELLVALNRVRRTTLMLVTHEPSLAAAADRRILLSAGRVVADDLPS